MAGDRVGARTGGLGAAAGSLVCAQSDGSVEGDRVGTRTRRTWALLCCL